MSLRVRGTKPQHNYQTFVLSFHHREHPVRRVFPPVLHTIKQQRFTQARNKRALNTRTQTRKRAQQATHLEQAARRGMRKEQQHTREKDRSCDDPSWGHEGASSAAFGEVLARDNTDKPYCSAWLNTPIHRSGKQRRRRPTVADDPNSKESNKHY